MICEVLSPDFTKSSVCSLLSTATAITVNRSMQKMKVTKNFFSMYQSIFLIIAKRSKYIIRETLKKMKSFNERPKQCSGPTIEVSNQTPIMKNTLLIVFTALALYACGGNNRAQSM